MTDEPKGLTFTVRDGGKKPDEPKEEEENKKGEIDYAVTNTKSSTRRKS